jgi:hypothetical protein
MEWRRKTHLAKSEIVISTLCKHRLQSELQTLAREDVDTITRERTARLSELNHFRVEHLPSGKQEGSYILKSLVSPLGRRKLCTHRVELCGEELRAR